MYYIVSRRAEVTYQFDLMDFLETGVYHEPHTTNVPCTVTRVVREIPWQIRSRTPIRNYIETLKDFNLKHKDLYDADRQTLYRTFYIPKKSGGYRRIDAPNEALKQALYELKYIFENVFNMLNHTAAFAYTKGRCPVAAMQRHNSNKSNWFLKTDFENFFGNSNPDFVYRMLTKIYPICMIVQSTEGDTEFQKAISLCFLNNGLPQGTPISPVLTNLMMIPFDFKMANDLAREHYVYTRYADDIQISHRYNFKFTDMVAKINDVLASFEAPFRIKDKKTRYGSSSGRNWNLGVMLTKDHRITVGRKRKEDLKHQCYNFVQSVRGSGERWEPHDIAVLRGNIAYLRSVEPEWVDEFIKYFNEKHRVNLMRMIREALS